MKQINKIILTIITLSCFMISANAFSRETNILSYYATKNYLDGQVYLDQTNILHFHPIFSLRNAIDSVRVCVQHSAQNEPYTREAEPVGIGKRYYSTLLPDFGLGESILRLDVEVTCNLDSVVALKPLLERYHLIEKEKEIIKKRNKGNNEQSRRNEQKTRKESITKSIQEIDKKHRTNLTELIYSLNDIITHMDKDDPRLYDKLGEHIISELNMRLRRYIEPIINNYDLDNTLIILLGKNLPLDSINRNYLFNKFKDIANKEKNITKELDHINEELEKYEELDSLYYSFFLYPEDLEIYKQHLDYLTKSSTTTIQNEYKSINESIDKLFSTSNIDIINNVNSLMYCSIYPDLVDEKSDIIDNMKTIRYKAKENREIINYMNKSLNSLDSRQNLITYSNKELIYYVDDLNYYFDDPIYSKLLENYLSIFLEYSSLVANQKSEMQKIFEEQDVLQNSLINTLYSILADTAYSGKGIQKSDILFTDSTLSKVRILYRLNDYQLRKKQALDPIEKMSIFSVRYIPFPITTSTTISKTHLIRFTGKESNTVFEFGLRFGDVSIPSTLFNKSDISLSRLEVAIALTPDTFGNEAEILALLFAYEFSTYSSIGVGCNLANNSMTPYYSLGINRRAFEALLTGVKDIFTSE